MNEQLLEYFKVATQKLEQGATALEKEIPLVVQEYLNWVWAESLIGVLFGLLAFIISCVITKITSAKLIKEDDPIYVPPLVFSVVGIVFFGFFCVYNIHKNIKVSVAPRIVILEKIGELTK